MSGFFVFAFPPVARLIPVGLLFKEEERERDRWKIGRTKFITKKWCPPIFPETRGRTSLGSPVLPSFWRQSYVYSLLKLWPAGWNDGLPAPCAPPHSWGHCSSFSMPLTAHQPTGTSHSATENDTWSQSGSLDNDIFSASSAQLCHC